MAVEYGDGFNASFKAGADLNTSTSDFQPVYVNSASSVIVASATTHRVIGILQNRPKDGTGAACWVRCNGFSKVTMNDTCTAGDLLMIGDNGVIRATGVSNTAAVTRSMIGRAMENSAQTNTVIPVLLQLYSIPGTLTVLFD